MSNTSLDSLKHISYIKELVIKEHAENKQKAREWYKRVKEASILLNNNNLLDENFFFSRDDGACSNWIEDEFNKNLFPATPRPKPKRRSRK